MFTTTLHLIAIAFVITEAVKIWMESKDWDQNFINSQTKTITMPNVITGDFDRNELIKLTAAEVNEPIEAVNEVLRASFKILATQVAQRGYASIHGFGSFRVDTIAARSGKDPQGNEFHAPERLTIEFNPEKRFRDELAELTGKKVI